MSALGTVFNAGFICLSSPLHAFTLLNFTAVFLLIIFAISFMFTNLLHLHHRLRFLHPHHILHTHGYRPSFYHRFDCIQSQPFPLSSSTSSFYAPIHEWERGLISSGQFPSLIDMFIKIDDIMFVDCNTNHYYYLQSCFHFPLPSNSPSMSSSSSLSILYTMSVLALVFTTPLGFLHLYYLLHRLHHVLIFLVIIIIVFVFIIIVLTPSHFA